jgi:hypothetical protein
VTPEYPDLVAPWSPLTSSATKIAENFPGSIQDNAKLPEILTGLEKMFGQDTPAAFVVKTVLLHMSINVVRDWPQAAPMTEDELKRHINPGLLPLLRVMMLSDNEGWTLFYPDVRAEQRRDTLKAFEEIEKLIA